MRRNEVETCVDKFIQNKVFCHPKKSHFLVPLFTGRWEGSVIQLRMQEIQFCGGRTEGEKENTPTLKDPFTDKSHLCAVDIQAR